MEDTKRKDGKRVKQTLTIQQTMKPLPDLGTRVHAIIKISRNEPREFKPVQVLQLPLDFEGTSFSELSKCPFWRKKILHFHLISIYSNISPQFWCCSILPRNIGRCFSRLSTNVCDVLICCTLDLWKHLPFTLQLIHEHLGKSKNMTSKFELRPQPSIFNSEDFQIQVWFICVVSPVNLTSKYLPNIFFSSSL